MKPLTVGEFSSLVHGRIVGVGPGVELTGFALDNREVRRGDLFIAIKGERVDGHDFAVSAVEKGAAAVLAERSVPAPHILTSNVVRALGDFAKERRRRFKGPVIGITGSAGKTTTKELVAAALSSSGEVLKTEGNRNSEFTSPLIWAELTPESKCVVVEMGMRGFGQIEYLASFTQPTIGVVTNIGFSHVEMVGSREGVARAKSELLRSLPASGNAVLWAEDPMLHILREATDAPISTFGFSEDADCRILDYHAKSWSSAELQGEVRGVRFRAELPAAGRHIALNAAAAVLTAALAGVAPEVAAESLARATFPPLRMEILEHAGATIVLDAYNASPSSVAAALETLHELPAQRRIAILGEMRELGSYAEDAHREIGADLTRFGVDLAILYGEPARWIGSSAQLTGMSAAAIRYVDTIEEIGAFLRTLQSGDVALIKGSRALELERAVEYLREKAC